MKPTRRQLLRAAASLPLLTAATRTAAANDLSRYLWGNRLIIIFSPSDTDQRLLDQRLYFAQQLDGLRDRDIVAFTVAGSNVLLAELGRKPEADPAALRRAYSVSEDTFSVLLIGKDGGEKARSDGLVLPETLFSIIDKMPMRRREMRERG